MVENDEKGLKSSRGGSKLVLVVEISWFAFCSQGNLSLAAGLRSRWFECEVVLSPGGCDCYLSCLFSPS
jgi:hypothetical protein